MAAYTTADLAALREAMASGVLRAKFADRDLTFRSLAEMREQEGAMVAALGLGHSLASGGAMYAEHSKGIER